MIRRQFDTLYREGAQSGRVMAICLHPFIIRVPHRIGALDAALAYILRHEGVWRATGSEIIEHYRAAAEIEELTYRAHGFFTCRELYFLDPSGNLLEVRDPTWTAGMPTPSLADIVGDGSRP